MKLIIMNPDKPSLELTKLKSAESMKIRLAMSFKRLVDDFQNTFSDVWNNSEGLSPQEVFDSFGTDAAELFQLADTVGKAIETLQPGSITTKAPMKYEINKDGTVTVGDPIKDGAAEIAEAVEAAVEKVKT